jgi:hypothetical protein
MSDVRRNFVSADELADFAGVEPVDIIESVEVTYDNIMQSWVVTTVVSDE